MGSRYVAFAHDAGSHYVAFAHDFAVSLLAANMTSSLIRGAFVQRPRTLAFHAGNTGSNPVRPTPPRWWSEVDVARHASASVIVGASQGQDVLDAGEDIATPAGECAGAIEEAARLVDHGREVDEVAVGGALGAGADLGG